MPQSDSVRQVTRVLGRPLVRLELEKVHANQAGIEEHQKGLDCSS
jgi:hypothetical protein